MKALKKTLVILVIILLTLISFGGIYVQKTKFVENILPEFKLGTDLTGLRNSKVTVSTEKNTVIYDEEGNVVEEETENTTTEEIPVNTEESLTKDNYQLSKEIIEERLKNFKYIQYTSSGITEEKAVEYYTIRQNEETGEISLQIPESDMINMVLQYFAIKATFNIVDENENILMDNSHIQNASVGFNSTDSGVTVYLNIEFNKEGTEKLKEISNTYVATEDEEGNDTTQKITIKVDDTEMLTTYFAEEILNGIISLSFGTASSSGDSLATYAQEASNLAVLLNSGNLPISYTIEENRYILPKTETSLNATTIISIALACVGIAFLIIKYKTKGLLTAVSFIGYIATLLIIIRLTNVILTLEGIVAILLSIALNFTFIVYLLHELKKNEEKTFGQVLAKFALTIIPVAVITIVFCFTKWIPIYSFGMTMFWGIICIMLYNLVTTKILIYKKANK